MSAEGLHKASPAGRTRLAGVVLGLGLAALAASAASAGGSATPARSPARTVSVTFTGSFKTVKKHTYTITVNASEPNGHTDRALAAVKAV